MSSNQNQLTEDTYWLIKTEPDCFSIDDLKRDKVTPWEGVRNYQARNFMLNGMRVGDKVLFYHSSCNPVGIVGVAVVASKPHPDLSAQRRGDEHFDPKATKEKPIWYCVDMKFSKKFKRMISLEEIKKDSMLSTMLVAKKGNRLSILPVLPKHFDRVLKLAGQ